MAVVPCPPNAAPVRGVVTFDPAVFKAAFPMFTTVADAALQLNFQLATLQLNNSCGSKVCDANEREALLNLLTAHITALKDGQNGKPPSGLVGRVSEATQGSVSVGTELGPTTNAQAFYAQTQWGLLYWQSTMKYRMFRYIAPPAVCADGGFLPPYGGGGCGC